MIALILLLTLASGVLGFWSSIYGGFANLIGGPSYGAVGKEDAYLTIDQLAEKYGYPLEVHTVVTEDEYILKMHRIPFGRKEKSNGLSVFLMHGIWESSDSWLLQGPNKALAYILADEGYDVWLGNARGNKHTYDHISLNANTSRFWEFSWEEIGYYDLPAMIDHALNITAQKSLYYIGYSQGTTTYFVMTSMRPEYNRKVNLMFALAPEVFMSNATSLFLKIFSPAAKYVPSLFWNWNIYTPDFISKISPVICLVSPLSCENFFITVMGPNNVSDALWPIVLGHTPTGSSMLQFLHYGQLAASRRFCRYDFGRSKNIVKYGKETPPSYNLGNVITPVILFYSNRDVFSNMRDVELLINRLPNIKRAYYVKDFTHVDYMYADLSKASIYMNIVKSIRNSLNKTEF